LATRSQTKTAGSAFALFCLSLILTAYSVRNPQFARVGSSFMGEILYPFSITLTNFSDWITSFKKEYVDLVSARDQNNELKDRIHGLESLNSQLLEERSENVRLRKLLSMKENHEVRGFAARVIGVDSSPWVQTISVDRGANDGIKVGLAVVQGQGVVGEIISVSSSSSKILLITDHASAIDSVVQGSRARGVVEGRGEQRTNLKYVLKESDVSLGDRVVTSGMDGVFPRGFLIGKVSSVKKESKGMFQAIFVTPAVNFSKLEEVFILTDIPTPDPAGLAAMMATPTPVPTHTVTPIATSAPKTQATPKPKKTPTPVPTIQETEVQ